MCNWPLITALDRAAHGLADDPLRRADDAQLAGALSAGSATSTPGSRRTSAASASSRPSPTRITSGACSPPTTQSYRETKLEAYRIMAACTSLSYLSMRLIQMVVMVAGSLSRAHGRAQRRRLRRLPAAGRRVLPPDREDQRGDRDLSQGHRRLPALPRTPRHRARHRRPPGAIDVAALRGDIALRERQLRLRRRHGRCCSGIDLDDPRRRDRRLRRPLGRRQDHDLLAAAALLRGRRRRGSRSTASTSAT